MSSTCSCSHGDLSLSSGSHAHLVSGGRVAAPHLDRSDVAAFTHPVPYSQPASPPFFSNFVSSDLTL